jgi:hypothetical protein
MSGSNQSLYFDKRITLKHINSMPKLKYILISVDYHSFYYSSQGIRDTWLYYDYDIKYKNKNEYLSDLSHFWFGYTPKITLSKIKERVLNYYNNEETEYVKNKGWVPTYGFNNNNFTDWQIKTRAKFLNNEIEKSVEREEILEDLRDFIIKLKERNIEPILITNPMFKEIFKDLNPTFIENNKKDIDNLTDEFNLLYLDFSSEFYKKTNFHNVDHLNEKGAVIYSRDINDLLKSKLNLN